jgi:hypothetical protein
MYTNHLDYFKCMAKALCEEVGKYPLQWRCSAPTSGEVAPIDWMQEVGHECETLYQEILVISGKSKKVRKLVCTSSHVRGGHEKEILFSNFMSHLHWKIECWGCFYLERAGGTCYMNALQPC